MNGSIQSNRRDGDTILKQEDPMSATPSTLASRVLAHTLAAYTATTQCTEA
jgi:hypothetical protein